VKAFARAFRYSGLLDEGRYGSISEMADAERLERGYLGSLLRMTLLAPDIVQSILDGRHLDEVTLPQVLEPLRRRWPCVVTRSGSVAPRSAAARTDRMGGKRR
jgi:hypothetical protein